MLQRAEMREESVCLKVMSRQGRRRLLVSVAMLIVAAVYFTFNF